MNGSRTLNRQDRGRSSEGPKAVVAATGLAKSISGEDVLRDVSISVREGEVHGMVGPNGAGKTTTIRLLLGLAEPDTGTVQLFLSTYSKWHRYQVIIAVSRWI